MSGFRSGDRGVGKSSQASASEFFVLLCCRGRQELAEGKPASYIAPLNADSQPRASRSFPKSDSSFVSTGELGA